jgi:hypothetical protein
MDPELIAVFGLVCGLVGFWFGVCFTSPASQKE